MASLTPAAVQNENLHIHRGKAVDGAKSGIIQDENLHILKGKVVEGFKAEKPKPAKARRKALKDLSQARKPVLSAANKATALKDKSTSAIREAAKKAQKRDNLTDEQIAECQEWAEEAQKRYNLTDEQIAKCQEWAEEGIEHMPSSYNDIRKFEDQQQEERVREEIAFAFGGLREWTDITFGLEIPVEEVPSDTEDTLQMKFEPEVLPPTPPRACRASSPKTSDYEEYDELLELAFSMEFYRQIDLIKLKEEYEDDAF